MDILTIRDRLNALPFRDGKRQILFGRVHVATGSVELLSDEVPPEPIRKIHGTAAVDYVKQLAEEVRSNGLELTRGEPDADNPDWVGLFIVQSLRHDSSRDMSWITEAVNWVARVTTVGMEMVVPGLVGLWLDRRFGTSFIGLIGFMLGVVLGVWHLLRMFPPRGPAGEEVK